MFSIALMFAMIGLFIALKTRGKYVPTFVLSFIGSFIFVRSAALFFGGYPDESDIWKMIEKTDEVDFSDTFKYYIALFFVTMILTTIFSFPEMADPEEDSHYFRMQ